MPFLSSFIFCLAPLISLTTMVIQRNHTLMTLLALEAMVLSLSMLVIIASSSSNSMEMFMILILLTFGACEASLGLACLVALARNFGNDLISSSSLSQC